MLIVDVALLSFLVLIVSLVVMPERSSTATVTETAAAAS